MYVREDSGTMRIALCQRRSAPNDVIGNLRTMLDDMGRIEADVYVFPEMFLTGYLYDRDAVEDGMRTAFDTLSSTSKEKGVAIVFGCPEFCDEGTYNCAYAITPDGSTVYRKIHLPNFPPFDEGTRFIPGDAHVVFGFGGYVFGLSICYDIFFPELTKACVVKGGAEVNICISASPMTSRNAFERVLTARALENTSYLMFVNNIGDMGPISFFGGSRAIAPNGDVLSVMEDADVAVITLDKDALATARVMRPVIRDTVPFD